MNRCCIAVVDASRARLFTFEELAAPAGARTQELTEKVALIDPARRRRPSEVFTDSRPGLDRAPSGRAFAYDDHRDAARRRMDRRFAADVASAIEELMREQGYTHLILAASPRMLGDLRELIAPLVSTGAEVEEMDRNLVHLSSAQLQDHLSAGGYLPARERIERIDASP